VFFLNFVVKINRGPGKQHNHAMKKSLSLTERAMAFDAQTIFANLAEKERLKGHHSAEGRAIRILSQAMNGWSSGNLSVLDVLIVCDQAIEDWLKARLKLSAWSTQNFPTLLERVVGKGLITRVEAVRLQKLHNTRASARDERKVADAHEVEEALEFSIQLVERYW
jgi:hypothetical protein